jgi:sugar phosphate isomerase/epimerase
MNIGVFNPILYDKSLKEALAYIKRLGVTQMELGVGGYPGTTHANAKELIKDKTKLSNLKSLFEDSGIKISALSVHANPIHPNAQIANEAHEDFVAACKLAKALNVDTVVTFSGCPAGGAGDKTPNFITCAWPADFARALDYQWNEVLIPYWKKAASLAESLGLKEIAIEMHPGFCVYNVETLLRLRAAVGRVVGANFDPSHLIWQGVNPLVALKKLLSENAVYNFHAKDTAFDTENTALNGVLDTKPYTDEINRSWIFRTVGYGSSDKMWKDMVSMLSAYGYKKGLSIEHEDSLMAPEEGLEKAVSYLKSIIITNPKPASISWA